MSTVTFEEARSLVARRFGPQHRPSAGAYMVADWGYEDGSLWRVIHGPVAELLQDSDLDNVILDPLVTFVFKDTGEIAQAPLIDVLTITDQMRPVGQPPGEDA